MSMEDVLVTINEESKQPRPIVKRGRRVVKPAMVLARKHKVENVNRNYLAQTLDAYAAEGRVIVAMNISRDIGGTYEIVSYKEEPAL